MSIFLETLESINNGTCIAECDSKLAELIKRVSEAKKGGTLNIAISARLTTARTVVLVGKVTTKLPAEPVIETMFFFDEDGHLHTQDPLQQKLPLQQMAPDTPTTLKQTLTDVPTTLKAVG